jgi:hypothetical protein
MATVDLIIAVCMLENPTACEEKHLYFESHGSLRACMFEAMPAMAEWAGNHPQWHVERFHCEWADTGQKKT